LDGAAERLVLLMIVALPAVLALLKLSWPRLVKAALPAVLVLENSMIPKGLLVKAALPPLTTPAPVNVNVWLLLKV
jgi:hypothetical protein